MGASTGLLHARQWPHFQQLAQLHAKRHLTQIKTRNGSEKQGAKNHRKTNKRFLEHLCYQAGRCKCGGVTLPPKE